MHDENTKMYDYTTHTNSYHNHTHIPNTQLTHGAAQLRADTTQSYTPFAHQGEGTKVIGGAAVGARRPNGALKEGRLRRWGWRTWWWRAPQQRPR